MERRDTEYEMEELIPIVADLSRKMTSMESSSITYEKAQQLMEAVLYCIRQWENAGAAGSQDSSEKRQILTRKRPSAREAYELGAQCVTEKVKRTLNMYHEILEDFDSYGNVFLYETVVKGMPEFFKWYDVRFCPQDTILTLDYPISRDLRNVCGIDAIREYLECIREEQEFLRGLDRNYVIGALRGHCSDYETAVINLRDIVMEDLRKQSDPCTVTGMKEGWFPVQSCPPGSSQKS